MKKKSTLKGILFQWNWNLMTKRETKLNFRYFSNECFYYLVVVKELDFPENVGWTLSKTSAVWKLTNFFMKSEWEQIAQSSLKCKSCDKLKGVNKMLTHKYIISPKLNFHQEKLLLSVPLLTHHLFITVFINISSHLIQSHAYSSITK